MPNVFEKSKQLADELILKAKDVEKGKSLEEAGIESTWMEAYARIAERNDRERRFVISRYPYESGPSVGAATGGFFDHREWHLRKGLGKHASMKKAVADYEAKYNNAAGFWASVHQSSIDIRQEAIAEKKDEWAEKFDVWSIIAVRYNLRVLGLHAEFCKIAIEDPTYAKMILPGLERRGDVATVDNLEEPLAQVESHMNAQLMKAVTTLSSSNSRRRVKGKGKGGAAVEK